MKFALMFLVTVAVSPAFAYLEAHWGTPTTPATAQYNTSERTYVVVSGEGFDDIGTQFTKAALSQVRKLRDMDPDAQVILLAARGNDNLPSVPTLASWAPDAFINTYTTDLTGYRLVQHLRSLQAIAGLFIYSHSIPTAGLTLESHMGRFSLQTPNMSSLASHFTPDAIAAFFGCNSGYTLASTLSRVWHIPVRGSFTSANFQRLHSNGHYYANDEGLYPSSDWSSYNTASFNAPWICPEGTCLRMKADAAPYNGVWGKFNAGLGFYKWFCGDLSDARCLEGMRKGAMAWVAPQNLVKSHTHNDVMNFINDFFCPEDKDGSSHAACAKGIAQALEDHNPTYSYFGGPSLQCDTVDCAVTMTLHGQLFAQSTNYGYNSVEGTSTTTMTEIRNYLRAFEQPQSERHSLAIEQEGDKSCIDYGTCLKAKPAF